MSKRIIGRKNIVVLLASCLFFIFLTGCGKEQYDNNTLIFNKDGSITHYIAEDFNSDEYNFEDWKNVTEEEIANYNSKNGEKVKLTDINYVDNKLSCKIIYADDDAYFDFNGEPLFYGTVAQAINAGYSLLVPVTDIKTAETLNSQVLQDKKDYTIAIFYGERTIYTFGDICFVSNNVGVGENVKKATITGDSTAYIVFK